MATNGDTSNLSPLRIVVGSDNAGHAYKTALKETLKNHKGVTEVLDVGVIDADDSTAYPHLAVDACKKIKAGEVSLPCCSNPGCLANQNNRLIERCSFAALD